MFCCRVVALQALLQVVASVAFGESCLASTTLGIAAKCIYATVVVDSIGCKLTVSLNASVWLEIASNPRLQSCSRHCPWLPTASYRPMHLWL